MRFLVVGGVALLVTGDCKHMWGYGSSPVIVGDRVILHTGPAERVFVPAFDVTSGEERWRHEEPLDGNGERNSDGNYMGSWSTPVLTESNGRAVAVCAIATRVCGFDVLTGKQPVHPVHEMAQESLRRPTNDSRELDPPSVNNPGFYSATLIRWNNAKNDLAESDFSKLAR